MAGEVRRVILPYAPRDIFKPYHSRTERWACLVAHRRAGKTVACINDQIKKAILLQEPHGRHAYVAPFLAQAKEVAWEYLKRYAQPIITDKNEGELWVELVNGARIRIHGADNPDRLRGSYLDSVILDEFADMRPSVWGEVIRPMLVDRKGWATFIGTPKGRNEFYDVHVNAKADPSWYSVVLTADETGIISDEELDDAYDDMTPEQYEQEFLCFPPGTAIWTAHGQKPIETLREGDVVLTHAGRWRPVKATITKQYSGELVEIRAYGDGRILRCTPEHPIRLLHRTTQTYSWVPASGIKKGDCVVMPRIKLSERPIITEAMATLLAWYLAEGTATGNSVTYSLGAKEDEFASQIERAALAYGANFTRSPPRRGAMQMNVNSAALADILMVQGGHGAANKRIPWGLIGGYERHVFDILMDGDGCVTKEGFSYTTISQHLARDVQVLAHVLGYGAGITVRPAHAGKIEGRDVWCAQSYSVQIRKGRDKIIPAKHGTGGYVREVKRSFYSGPVHNLHVAVDESYVAEGRVVHNCSFDAAILGAYFGKEIAKAEQDGRITNVPYDPQLPVHTVWDLGKGANMAIWFFQVVMDEVRVIDHHEGSHDDTIPECVKVLDGKPYKYGDDWVPHDAKVKEIGTGRTRVETLINLGRKPSLVPDHNVMDGINAGRVNMAYCWFDKEKCKDGLEALRQYHAEYDEKTKTFKDTPKHDWTSHTADAYRYLTMAYKVIVPEPVKQKPAGLVIGPNPPPGFRMPTLDEVIKSGKDEPKANPRI